MRELDRWIETTRERLIASGDRPGSFAVIVGTIAAVTAAVLARRTVLSSPKPGTEGGARSGAVPGNVEPVAGIRDGGTDAANARDPQDRETIAVLLRLLDEKSEAAPDHVRRNKVLEEQVERAVLGLERVGAEQGGSKATVDEAKHALARGDMTRAEALYVQHIEHDRAEKSATRREMAESCRSLGVLAFLHDTGAALGYYREAIRLDFETSTSWNQLGRLQQRAGELKQAERAYGRVLDLADAAGDASLKAVGYGDLGLVYEIQGELDRAVEMYEKALEVEKALGRERGVADQHGNLGLVCQMRGDLDQAVEMYEKALEIDEALGRKESVANACNGLGLIHETRGELDRAAACWQRAASLFGEIGSPNATLVRGWLGSAES